MGGIETAERIIEEFEKVSSNTKKTIAYTHFHADHILGAQAFTEKYDVDKIISHRSTIEEVEKFFGIKRDVIGPKITQNVQLNFKRKRIKASLMELELNSRLAETSRAM